MQIEKEHEEQLHQNEQREEKLIEEIVKADTRIKNTGNTSSKRPDLLKMPEGR